MASFNMLSQSERDELVTGNMGLAYKAAKCVAAASGLRGRHMEDLQQDALAGLVNASKFWDASKSRFSTFGFAAARNSAEYAARSLKRQNTASPVCGSKLGKYVAARESSGVDKEEIAALKEAMQQITPNRRNAILGTSECAKGAHYERRRRGIIQLRKIMLKSA